MDKLTRSVITRLSTLREIGNAVKKVVVEDPNSKVSFLDLATAVGPLLDRTPGSSLYRDLRQTARLLGLVVSWQMGGRRCVRGVRLK